MRALVHPPAKALNFYNTVNTFMQTNEEFLSDLINTAETGKHEQFRLLKSWQEYCYMRRTRRGQQLLITSIEKSIAKLFNAYCKAASAGESKVYKLLAYCALKNVLLFYKEELRITRDMLEEYECYLAYGNWLDFVFGFQRPLDKLWDHRG